jgi:hypothetical protein
MMTIGICSGTFAAITFGLAVELVAQAPPRDVAKSLTVMGCLQRTVPSPPGTTGIAGAYGTSATKFLLTNAAKSATGTTGTTGKKEPSTDVPSEYRLDADDAKLAPHVGHKVEIAGIIEEPTSTTPNQPPTAESAASRAPKLKVDTVRMIASTCP